MRDGHVYATKMPRVSTKEMSECGHATGMCCARNPVRHQAQREKSPKRKRQTTDTSGCCGHHNWHLQKWNTTADEVWATATRWMHCKWFYPKCIFLGTEGAKCFGFFLLHLATAAPETTWRQSRQKCSCINIQSVGGDLQADLVPGWLWATVRRRSKTDNGGMCKSVFSFIVDGNAV